MNLKNVLNGLMLWMLPHISYMRRDIICDNIRDCVLFYYMEMEMKPTIHSYNFLKTLEKKRKLPTDDEFIEYCYNITLYTEGL